MDGIQPWMQLKVKTDTFFVPNFDGTVYFRNNIGSFRMEGLSVQAWIEKLLPIFDGVNTLESLTDGLPEPYQERILEIAKILYENGFVRDVSADARHGLNDELMRDDAPQIELVDNLKGSGAFSFEMYRNLKVLAIGSGEILRAAIDALSESGLSEICAVELHDVSDHVEEWDAVRNLMKTMNVALYVSDTGDLDALRRIEAICLDAGTWFLPAVLLKSVGVVGPLVRPKVTRDAYGMVNAEDMGEVSTSDTPDASDALATWDSMWRRIHESAVDDSPVDEGFTKASSRDAASRLLVNVAISTLFQAAVEIDDGVFRDHVYLLQLETLTGGWHKVFPARSSVMDIDGCRLLDADQLIATQEAASDIPDIHDALTYFSQLTDPTSGIFHVWDEGALKQLPLALCRVQSIDALSAGPACLLPERIVVGLTHQDARREAGLTGVEAYVERMVKRADGGSTLIGVGAGLTWAEAVGRGLNLCLVDILRRRIRQRRGVTIRLVDLDQICDERCLFSLDALRVLGIDPAVGLGSDIHGYPAMWIGWRGKFVGSVGLHPSRALQRALEWALARETQVSERDISRLDSRWVVEASTYEIGGEMTETGVIEPWSDDDGEFVGEALEMLANAGAHVTVRDLTQESFMTDVLAGVVGVSIREGESE